MAVSFGLVAQPAFAHDGVAAPPAQSVNSLALKLPIGDIQLFDANLQVTPGKNNVPERFRGSARVKLPDVGPLASLKMSDLVRADIGLDTGAALSYLGAPLDKDRRYLFLDVGGGLNVTREVKDDSGAAQEIKLTIPPGQRVALVIDPDKPLIFMLGSFSVSYTGDLAVIGNLLAAQGLNLSLLDSVQIPGLSTVVISGTVAPGSGKSFGEVQASTGVDAGAIGAALGVQAAPLVFRGGARLDGGGLTVTGVTQSKVAPEKGWDGKAIVQFRVPFDGQQAWVDLTGALSAPLARIQTEGAKRVTVDGQAIANAVETAASGAGDGVEAAATAVAKAGGSAASGVQGAVSKAATAAPTVVSAASSAVGTGWQAIMQQVCKATRRC